MTKPLYVTRPDLPELETFLPYLQQIWQSGVLTNNGPFHQQLEQALQDYLGVDYISVFNNGTNALLVALQALELKGEVITTPFTFLATTSSLIWQGLTPVFVDIDPVSLNLDPNAIAAAITDKSCAIMPVHCYGNPCDTSAIRAVAQQHGLKVIYDAAHAFGVKHQGQSVLQEGDLAVLSFHATKVFNTIEGGAVICHSAQMKQKIDRLKNFGIVNEFKAEAAGINGKMNELQAAFGLAQLPGLAAALQRRAKVHQYYCDALARIPGLQCVPLLADGAPNYAYFPILVTDEFGMSCKALYEALKAKSIFARRYFYPLTPVLLDMDIDESCYPVAADAAERVLCLPMAASLTQAEQDLVINAIIEVCGKD